MNLGITVLASKQWNMQRNWKAAYVNCAAHYLFHDLPAELIAIKFIQSQKIPGTENSWDNCLDEKDSQWHVRAEEISEKVGVRKRRGINHVCLQAWGLSSAQVNPPWWGRSLDTCSAWFWDVPSSALGTHFSVLAWPFSIGPQPEGFWKCSITHGTVSGEMGIPFYAWWMSCLT